MAERRAGKYLVDGYIAGATTAYEVLYRAKILNSVRDALILPEVIDRARTDNVMVYAVGMRSRRQQHTAPGTGMGGLQAALLADLPDPGLARVAEETGGGYTEIRYGEDLVSAFGAVADELHSQYLLGFAPPKRDGKVHKIEIRTPQKGLKVRGQRSYVAPSDKP